MKKETVLKWLEVCVVLGIGFILIIGILYKSGVIRSGYHFVDDHEVLRMEMIFENGESTLGEQIGAWLQNDLSWRFRPFYWVERVLGSYLFGADMLLWNIYTAIKGVLSFALLYYVARYLGHNPIISTLFPSIIMLGEQFTPWYRSANQENTGLLFMAMVLYLIAGQYAKRKFTCPVYNVLIVLFTILCGLVKESFAMCIPAFMAFKFWLEYCDAGKEPYYRDVSYLSVFKNNMWTYIALLVVGLGDLYGILFVSGVDNVDYAGFQENTTLMTYINGICNSLTVYLKWYTLFGAMLIFIAIMCCHLFQKKFWKQYLGFGLIGFYIIVVQLAAHAKSLMWERYIIPCIVGYAFVFVLLGYELFSKHVFQRRVYTGILVLLLLLEIPLAYKKAVAWAYDGQMIAQYFQCILDNSAAEDVILCSFSDEELNLSSDYWLDAHERPNVEFYQGGAIAGETYAVVTCYNNQVAGMVAVLEAAGEDSYSVCEYMNYSVILLK